MSTPGAAAPRQTSVWVDQSCVIFSIYVQRGPFSDAHWVWHNQLRSPPDPVAVPVSDVTTVCTRVPGRHGTADYGRVAVVFWLLRLQKRLSKSMTIICSSSLTLSN